MSPYLRVHSYNQYLLVIHEIMNDVTFKKVKTRP